MSEVVTFPIDVEGRVGGRRALDLVRAHRGVGAPGQVIAEVSVDKVSWDVEAPIDGAVTCLVDEEAAVPQGSPIARID